VVSLSSIPENGDQCANSNEGKDSKDWLWPAANLLVNVLASLGKCNHSQHKANHGSPATTTIPILKKGDQHNSSCRHTERPNG